MNKILTCKEDLCLPNKITKIFNLELEKSGPRTRKPVVLDIEQCIYKLCDYTLGNYKRYDYPSPRNADTIFVRAKGFELTDGMIYEHLSNDILDLLSKYVKKNENQNK